MKIEKRPLALGESVDVDYALSFDAHALELRLVGDPGDDDVAGILEADAGGCQVCRRYYA